MTVKTTNNNNKGNNQQRFFGLDNHHDGFTSQIHTPFEGDVEPSATGVERRREEEAQGLLWCVDEDDIQAVDVDEAEGNHFSSSRA